MTTQSAPTAPRYLTVAEVAERWHEKPRAVADKIRRHELRATKPGREWLVELGDVQAFEDARMNIGRTAKRTRRPQRRGGAK